MSRPRLPAVFPVPGAPAIRSALGKGSGVRQALAEYASETTGDRLLGRWSGLQARY